MFTKQKCVCKKNRLRPERLRPGIILSPPLFFACTAVVTHKIVEVDEAGLSWDHLRCSSSVSYGVATMVVVVAVAVTVVMVLLAIDDRQRFRYTNDRIPP